MATPNYGYEKRQRELAKKKKKEEKLKAKQERKLHPGEAPEQGVDSQEDEAGLADPSSATASAGE